MSTKKKYKRDYIILEAKDMNFRYKERVLPKAFAKVEVTEDKSLVALYVENLKYVRDGYKVIAILEDYNTVDLGNIVLSEQGKGEYTLKLEEDNTNIKAVALVFEKSIPLIGFKGSKIDNYEEILFTSDKEYVEYEEIEDEYEYEEVEYIEVDDNDEEYEYEYLEYVEIDDNESESDYEDKVYENQYIERAKSKNKKDKVQQLEDDKIREDYRGCEEIHQIDNEAEYEEIDSSKVKNLLMPRQIKKGLRMFKEVKPFVTDTLENSRWWKMEITPMTMCGYTMPYLGYINTLNYTMYSDIVLQSYKYRHYLFGVQYDEYNKRKYYMYAIPGNKNEQPDQGNTGFNTYKPCDDRSDKLGYWICFIDSRTRKIVK